MEPRKLSSSLATLGALLVAIAFFWWLSVFASIPHELRSAAPIGQVLPCLLFTSGFVCAGFQLLGGYSPILLWLGIALLGASWWVTQSRSASSASEKAKSGIDFGRMARSFAPILQHPKQSPKRPPPDAGTQTAVAPAGSPPPRPAEKCDSLIRLLRQDGGQSLALSAKRLRHQAVVMGRSSTCDEVIADSSISRTHAKVWIDRHDRLLVEDLGSSNGTLCDGQKVKRSVLATGTRLRFGRVEFEVEIGN